MITVQEYVNKAKTLDNIDVLKFLDKKQLFLSPMELLPNYPEIPYKEQFPNIDESDIFEKYIFPQVVAVVMVPPKTPSYLIEAMVNIIQINIEGTA